MPKKTSETSWSLLDLSEKIKIIETGLRHLTFRSGRKCERIEIATSPDDPGAIKVVKFQAPEDPEPVAEYEIRSDPPRIVIRMRGTS